MATNKNPIFLNSIVSKNIQIDNADGVASEVIFSAGVDGGALVKMSATTDDTADVIVVITSNDGTQVVPLGEVTVPAGAGTDGSTPAKNLLDEVALPGVLQADGSLVVGANASISVAAKSAVTATKTLDIASLGGSYSA